MPRINKKYFKKIPNEKKTITLNIPRSELLKSSERINSDDWIKRSEKMWAKARDKAERTADKTSEKYRLELKKHVDKHSESRWVKKGHWELKCWLGKRPTGRLFRTILTDNVEAGRWQLANDMWDFLFTPKGEQIIKAEYKKKHGEPWQSKIWQTEKKK